MTQKKHKSKKHKKRSKDKDDKKLKKGKKDAKPDIKEKEAEDKKRKIAEIAEAKSAKKKLAAANRKIQQDAERMLKALSHPFLQLDADTKHPLFSKVAAFASTALMISKKEEK